MADTLERLRETPRARAAGENAARAHGRRNVDVKLSPPRSSPPRVALTARPA